ncbi:MAG: hypothetical protein ISS54_00755 [Dehalococcoidia bacterium]|nr:hypothetical protein [Dehalococcoidia bacterium]
MDANFCPECAQPLNRLDWNLQHERVKYLSCGEHYFELVQRDADITLRQLTLKWCTVCGSLIPYLKDRNGKCQDCHERLCREWRMDPAESNMLLEITPRISSGGTSYHCYTSITIRPYPNPCTFGGSYGGQVVETEEALEHALAVFNEEAARYRQQGMEKVEIKRSEPIYVESQEAFIQSSQVEEQENEAEQDDTIQMSLL